MVWFRLTSYFKHKNFLLYLIARVFYNHYQNKYGFQIPYATNIGPGFYIGHFGCVVINHRATIGRNVNISHDVTIGKSNRGERKGVATIGNNVYIAPGVKIIGKVNIGNNTAIGANAVVTQDVPDNAVVAGIPARVISMNGSDGYVNNII